jgi:polyisoprenoid-binding protein YceI
MKKYWIVIIITVGFCINGYAQTYVTKNGMIRFYSEAPLEKIEAVNRQVNTALLVSTGDFVFKVLIKSFNFEKALMQEHFNENYLESDKYPEATFLGKITNIKDINFTKEGIYPATVEGKLTIHGQTQLVKQNGTLEIKNGAVTAKSKFNILLSDYNISIPNTVVNKISKSIEVTVEVMMTKLNL